MLRLVELLRDTIGDQEHEVRFEPPRQGEVYRNYARIEKARKELKHLPVTTLEVGLRQTWGWFRSSVHP